MGAREPVLSANDHPNPSLGFAEGFRKNPCPSSGAGEHHTKGVVAHHSCTVPATGLNYLKLPRIVPHQKPSKW